MSSSNSCKDAIRNKKKICTYKQMRFKNAGIICQGNIIRSQCTCKYDVILIVAARGGSNGFFFTLNDGNFYNKQQFTCYLD